MTKKVISKTDLEGMILQRLKEKPDCNQAQTVFIEKTEEASEEGNWFISHFNPGESGRDECEAALWDIQAELLPGYTLA